MFKAVEDFQQINRIQFEAASQSAAAVSRGLQQLFQEASSLTKTSWEDGSAMVGQLVGAKSIEGAVRVQTDYAKTAYQSYVTGMKRFGDLYAAIFNDACKPFENMAGTSRELVTQ